MMRSGPTRPYAIAAVLALALSACGGGNGAPGPKVGGSEGAEAYDKSHVIGIFDASPTLSHLATYSLDDQGSTLVELVESPDILDLRGEVPDDYELIQGGRFYGVPIGKTSSSASNSDGDAQITTLGGWLEYNYFEARVRRLRPGRCPGVYEASLPFRTKDDPPTGGQGRSHDGKMLIVGAIPWTLRRNRRRSRRHRPDRRSALGARRLLRQASYSIGHQCRTPYLQHVDRTATGSSLGGPIRPEEARRGRGLPLGSMFDRTRHGRLWARQFSPSIFRLMNTFPIPPLSISKSMTCEESPARRFHMLTWSSEAYRYSMESSMTVQSQPCRYPTRWAIPIPSCSIEITYPAPSTDPITKRSAGFMSYLRPRTTGNR